MVSYHLEFASVEVSMQPLCAKTIASYSPSIQVHRFSEPDRLMHTAMVAPHIPDSFWSNNAAPNPRRLASVESKGVLECLLALATGDPGRVRTPLRKTSLRNFGNSVYPALPGSFGGDTKSRRSPLSGVYARGSKISHQFALECVTVVDYTTHSNPPPVRSLWHRRTALFPCQL